MKLRSFAAIAALAVGLIAPSLHAAEVETVDRIVAVVNREVITANELAARVNAARTNLKQQKIAEPPLEVLNRQVLERMINERVQLQYAANSGVKVDDAQLENAVNSLAKQNKMSVPEFRDALAKQGITFSQFRSEIRNEITLQRVRTREIDNRIFCDRC